MCFTQPISLGFTLFGMAGGATMLYLRPKEKRAGLPLIYFASMELLQFVMYFVLGECASDLNKALSIIGWVHIAFQPVISNLGHSASTARGSFERRAYERIIIPLSAIAGLALALRTVGVGSLGAPCDPKNEVMCGEQTCTLAGPVHLYWIIRMRNAGDYWTPSIFVHGFLMFVPPMLLGQLTHALFLIITGPVLALVFSSGNQTQAASIWCFYSVSQSVLLAALYWYESRGEYAKDKKDKKEKTK